MLEVMWKYDFLQYAFFVGIVIGFLAPVLGVFIVVRRQAMIADALSHITLTGIAFHLYLAQSATFLQTVHPLYMGMGFAVAGSIIMERLRNVYSAYKELAVPIILSIGIGLGVVFLSLADGFNNDLFQYLFGSIIAVSQGDVWLISVVALVVVLLLFFFYKELFFMSFDEEQAKISSIPVRSVNLLFSVMAALVIASSMRILGILLVSSLSILPVAAAMQVAKSFKQTFLYAVLFGEISVIAGLITAFYLDVAPGGMIAIFALILLLLVLSGKKYDKIRRLR
ncbi:metal ABC transporter permease [Alteribacillus iranensis]|uniref:Zinc transport system permease protein n=1 Tax=Alteribacillus iranensis TaxID=930128 RepID=A0A1I1ZCR0_9BACI|nr:metal ABC transporter permease [Alteribacillus iranensis]SFE29499.1 zinc transport system permease protein [Alteribacillus iranensis]